MSVIARGFATIGQALFRAWRFGLRVVNMAAVPAALACLWMSLHAAGPSSYGAVANRTLAIRPIAGLLAKLPVANVAAWPLQMAWEVVKAFLRQQAHALQPLAWLAVAVLLILVANWLNWSRQTVHNRTAKAAVIVWVGALVLAAFDLYRVVEFPLAWDDVAVVAGLSRGAVLRGAEIAASVYLWSVALVLKHSRADAHIIRPWGQISGQVRRQLVIRSALLIAVLPYLLRAIASLLNALEQSTTATGLLSSFYSAAVALALFWGFIGGKMLEQFVALFKFASQILATRPLITETFAPPALQRTAHRT